MWNATQIEDDEFLSFVTFCYELVSFVTWIIQRFETQTSILLKSSKDFSASMFIITGKLRPLHTHYRPERNYQIFHDNSKQAQIYVQEKRVFQKHELFKFNTQASNYTDRRKSFEHC